MKIFQIVDNFCYYDATAVHPTLADTEGKYPPDILFVEAPDKVFEGWGYNPDAEGDARFIKPTPPEGWLYDDATGTFYPADGEKPKPPTTTDDEVVALKTQNAQLEAKVKALTESSQMLEDCLVEMAEIVYA